MTVMLAASGHQVGLLRLRKCLQDGSTTDKAKLLAVCHAYLADQVPFESQWEAHLSDWIDDQMDSVGDEDLEDLGSSRH